MLGGSAQFRTNGKKIWPRQIKSLVCRRTPHLPTTIGGLVLELYYAIDDEFWIKNWKKNFEKKFEKKFEKNLKKNLKKNFEKKILKKILKKKFWKKI